MKPETKMKKERTWQIRPFREEDKASFMRLSKQHFGEKDLASEEYLDWLRKGGPAGPAYIPVAEEIATGEVVGFLFQVPFQVKFGESYEICRLGCNALVRSDYRGYSVYSAMQKLTTETIRRDSIFSYGFPKPKAVVPHKKTGRFPVGTIPMLVRPLDIAQLAKSRFGNPILRLGIQAGWQVAAHTIWRPQRPNGASHKIQVQNETRFDEKFDRFWDRVADKYEIIIKRDRGFLNWRFIDLCFRSYEIMSAQVDSELVGYIVLREVEIENVKTGFIMDLLVEKSQRGEQAGLKLVAAANDHFKKAGMALGGCIMMKHTQEYHILRRAGYVEPPEKLSPQIIGLMALSLSERATHENLADPKRWFITMANHDAV